MIKFRVLIFFVALKIGFLVTGCGSTSISPNVRVESIDSLREDFYQKFNSIYRNIDGDIWIFPVDGEYRMAAPNSSSNDRLILEKYKSFIEIRGWNSENEEIELTGDNIEEVLDYCIKKAGNFGVALDSDID